MMTIAPNAYAITWPDLFVSVDPALLLTQPGTTQDVTLYNNAGNTYVNKTGAKPHGTVILGVGFRAYQNENFQINTGLRFLPVADTPLNGDIWQLHSPLFNDLAYKFHVKSNLLLVDTLFSWSQYRLQPGVIIGFGRSNNTTADLREVPLSESGAPSLQQISGTNHNQFAYDLGAAFDYSVDNCNIELAYRYINAGNGVLQPFPLQNTKDSLSTGTLQYHVISLGMRAYYEL